MKRPASAGVILVTGMYPFIRRTAIGFTLGILFELLRDHTWKCCRRSDRIVAEKVMMMNDLVEVLYVYRCTACGHRAELHLPDDSHDGEARPVVLLSVSSGTVASRLRIAPNGS